MLLRIFKKLSEMIAYVLLSEGIIAYSMLIIPTWRIEIENVSKISYIKTGCGVLFITAALFYTFAAMAEVFEERGR